MNNNILESEDYRKSLVRIDKTTLTLFELKIRYEEGKRVILNPDFKATTLWREESQKSALIESILMSIPIPIFYFFETKWGEMEIADGKNRFITLIDFVNNKFPLTKLTHLTIFNGIFYKDLPPMLQAKLEDYKITAYIVQPPISDEIKRDILKRVNIKREFILIEQTLTKLCDKSIFKE